MPARGQVGPRSARRVTLTERLAGLRQSAQARAAAGASAWSIGGYAATTVLRFTSRIVLAKLLPNAGPMGTVAVVATILGGLELISDLGIGVNVVQHERGAEPAFLGTAFSVQALRGVALWILASAIAFPLSWLYHDPQIAPLLLFGALGVLFRCLISPALSVMSRNLQLRIPTLISFTSEIVGFAVTVAWTLKAPSAWAMVAGTVATSACYAVGPHVFSTRIGFRWDRQAARSIVHFGAWILVATAAWFLSSRGETLMLKGSVPDIAFGCFAFASMLVSTPTTAVTQLGSQVFLPMMSAWLRDTPLAAPRQYRRARWLFTGLALCWAGGAILLGPMLVKLLHLNASFAGLGWMVQVLGFRAAQDVLSTPLTALLLATGSSRFSARASTVRLVAMMAGLLLTVPRWGLQGAMFALCGASLVSYLAMLPGTNRLLPGAARLELASFLLFLAGSAAVVLFAGMIGLLVPWNT
jgi:O-antigen/teichoic acid export membrane protein